MSNITTACRLYGLTSFKDVFSLEELGVTPDQDLKHLVRGIVSILESEWFAGASGFNYSPQGIINVVITSDVLTETRDLSFSWTLTHKVSVRAGWECGLVEAMFRRFLLILRDDRDLRSGSLFKKPLKHLREDNASWKT